ncbi:MAG: MBL fold metallo-hydrolase [Bacteroidota bacterium]
MIHILDLQFLDSPNTIASFLVETSARPILIETGPYSTFQQLRSSLQQKGYEIEDIKHVFITHIHLDHAGAAWAFAEKGAKIYLHPFGYKHMNDPSKLIQSATRIYQDDMERLWSTLKPIAKDKLQIVEDKEVISVGDIDLVAHHTPGHASHHIAWQLNDVIFTGDVAGVKIEHGPVVPPCPPPDINIEAWKESIERLKSLSPKTLYLTHYGTIENIDSHFDLLVNSLDEWANWILPHYKQGTPKENLTPLFQNYVSEDLKKKGVNDDLLVQYEKANPSWMSVAGLLRYWRKKMESK